MHCFFPYLELGLVSLVGSMCGFRLRGHEFEPLSVPLTLLYHPISMFSLSRGNRAMSWPKRTIWN